MAGLELRELVPHARMPDRLVFGYEWPVYVGVKEVGGRSCVYGLIKQESKLYSGGRALGRGQTCNTTIYNDYRDNLLRRYEYF